MKLSIGLVDRKVTFENKRVGFEFEVYGTIVKGVNVVQKLAEDKAGEWHGAGRGLKVTKWKKIYSGTGKP